MIVHIAKMTGVAGTENHLLTLLPGLQAQGIQIHLIVLTEPEKPMDAYIAEMNRRGVPSEGMVINQDVEYGLIGRLAERLRILRPEAVHTHLIHADWHGVIAARRVGIRRIYWSGHNDDPFRYRPLIRLIQAYLWRRVTVGIAISEAVRQFMIKVEFAPPDKVVTVRYGLDPASPPPESRDLFRAELGLSSSAFVFGSVCRLIEQKGLPHAIHAFKSLSGAYPNAHYVIIGDGKMRGELEALIDSLGLRGRVHLAGWRANAAALMNAFDAFLMPSLWEGFGLVVLEAMAARLPVIASNVSALPEIVVQDETGLLVGAGDTAGLEKAMRYMVGDSEGARRMGAAGRTRLESQFSVARMVEQTVQVYQRRGVSDPHS